MDVSKFLSKVIGSYLYIVGIVMFVNMHQFLMNVNRLMSYTPLLFLAGFITLILGLLMVISHNVWQWNWRVIITVFAWITLVKGIVLILCPHCLDKITFFLTQNISIAYLAAGVDFVLGALLGYYGFSHVKWVKRLFP